MSKLQSEKNYAFRIYEVFVHIMSDQFGGPKRQKRLTKESAQRIDDLMRDKDGEQLCYELCREYLSNAKPQPTIPLTPKTQTDNGRGVCSPPFSFPATIRFHLNEAQRDFILRWLRENTFRPGVDAYEQACRTIKKRLTAAKPPISDIPATKPDATGLILTKRFHAVKHLPPGWAVTEAADRFVLENAGEAMLSLLWNRWALAPDKPFSMRGGQVGLFIAKQFCANDMEYPSRE